MSGPRSTRRAWWQATAALAVVAAVALSASAPAGARQTRTRASLATVDGLGTAQVAALQRGGIRSIAALAAASPATVTHVLSLDAASATRLIERAKGASVRMTRSYAEARARFSYSTPTDPSLPAAEDPYARRIRPTNECTVLVRKVCGLEHQCAAVPGCSLAKQLLDTYNAGADKTPIAESCVIALEDGIVFPACTTP